MSQPKISPLPPPEVTPTRIAPPAEPRSRWVWIAIALVVTIIAGYWLAQRWASRESAAQTAARSAARSVPVSAIPARRADMPVVVGALGAVSAFNTVTVRSRVDGQLVKVGFQEGQFVNQGDLLAQIDPRPFEAQLTQAEGQLARDLAQLRDARLNLERFKGLLEKQFISKQQYDDQAATVGQFEGTVKLDQGAIAAAKLQLDYSHITAPIAGRVGLRLVDVGNMVHQTDTNGLVVITQLQPIAVLFTIPEDHLPAVLAKLQGSTRLAVEAYDRSGRSKIAGGELIATDNQIDPTTGTFKLKAVFQNADRALFPNQFVNVRLLLDVRKDATIIPAAAVQRGPQGTFAYVVKTDQTVEVRPVTTGIGLGDDVSIDKGISPDELIVVEGTDKLREGTKVQLEKSSAPAAKPKLRP